jgi:hypothetical protein
MDVVFAVEAAIEPDAEPADGLVIIGLVDGGAVRENDGF